MSFLKKLFRKQDKSGNIAKERLKSVLMADRSEIAGGVMESIKLEILKLLRSFKELDAAGTAFMVERADKQSTGMLNIMIPLSACRDVIAV